MFECQNCGRKHTPSEVVEHKSSCVKCGDTVVAYSIDVAEYILRMEKSNEPTKRDTYCDSFQSGPSR